jgi:hypothetical protein
LSRDFQADGINAVAICLIHAYANPHEEAMLAELQRLWPEVWRRSHSHQITREWREYERTSTTVLSAYVQPAPSAISVISKPGYAIEQGYSRRALCHAVELRRRFAGRSSRRRSPWSNPVLLRAFGVLPKSAASSASPMYWRSTSEAPQRNAR